MASSDGYCTVTILGESMPASSIQQRDLQLHLKGNWKGTSASGSLSTDYKPSVAPLLRNAPSREAFTLGIKRAASPPKNIEPLDTPATEQEKESRKMTEVEGAKEKTEEGPAKKKRRVELKHHGAA